MKSTFFRLAAVSLALFGAVRASAAFNPAIVGSDARWVVYLDFAKARDSALAKEMLNSAGVPEGQIAVGGTQLDFSKVLALLGSATGYGTNLTTDPKAIDGTLLVDGSPQLKTIVDGLLAQFTLTNPKNVTDVKDLGYTAYSIGGDVFVAFPPEPVIIVSKSKEQLLKAREVFRGTAPSLAKTPASPLTRLLANAGTSYLFAASVVPTENLVTGNGPDARILQMAKSGSLAIGESANLTSLHIKLIPNSEDVADKLVKVVQGTMAMVSLVQTNDEALGKFIDSANVQKENGMVSLDLSYPTADLTKMIAALRDGTQVAPDVGSSNARGELIVATWKTDPAPAGAAPKEVTWKTVENVHLENSMTIVLRGNPNSGPNARVDRIEISEAGAAKPLAIQAAPLMRLSGYMPAASPFDPSQRVINTINPSGGSAQFVFNGQDGDYTIRVAYVNEPEGKATFTLSTRPRGNGRGGPPALPMRGRP